MRRISVVRAATAFSALGVLATGFDSTFALAADTDNAILGEVTVTAQKRQERLQDVPVPVTVLDTQSLLLNNRTGIVDYYATVPGLNLQTRGDGSQSIAIRGVTTGRGTSRAVGVLVDETPFGGTSALGAVGFAPDIDPADLERIEVLRGPQGTLYGASSIGGLIKYVTVDPSTERLSARVETGVSTVRNGNGAGHELRGSVNVPVNDTTAIRLSAFDQTIPGYIDDPVFKVQGLNRNERYGGRASLLWKPADRWSLKVNALMQNNAADGLSQVTLKPGLGDLQQVQTLPDRGYLYRAQSYSVVLNAPIGSANLTSITSYNINRIDTRSDGSSVYGGIGAGYFGNLLVGHRDPIYGGLEISGHHKVATLAQELRLSGSLFSRLDYLGGLFYTHDAANPATDEYTSYRTDTFARIGPFLHNPYPTTYTEIAAFADLTYHFTDRFDIQFGARRSENRQWYQETIAGLPFNTGIGESVPVLQQPRIHSKDGSFTYLVTPTFKISPDLMVYARLASGYRPGGPNQTCIVFPTPCKYEPDKTYNYEIGTKGSAFDNMISFDVSVYYIDWKKIQLNSFNGINNYFANGNDAESKGIELSVQARPAEGLSVTASMSFNQAELTDDLPKESAAYGVKGDRLPYSARFSGSLSAEQNFLISTELTGFAGGGLSYVGSREDVFVKKSDTRLEMPGYAEANIYGGVRYDDWTVNLALNNLADKRGVVGYINPASTPYSSVSYIQPRTLSLSASKKF